MGIKVLLAGGLIAGVIALVRNFDTIAEKFKELVEPIIKGELGQAVKNLFGSYDKEEGTKGGQNIPVGMRKMHSGGELVGPAIIRNDEYVLIPPSNAGAGQVMTPQQASTGNDKPVTVVINVDGREFVKQTVFPALNKEFNLQGIG